MSRPILFAVVCGLNLLSFSLMGADKSRAHRGIRRIRERTLWLSALCFGALGAMAAMLLFRHKTLHASFVIGYPILFAIQLAALIFIARAIP